MTPSEDLFKLIKSLSPNEKGYFKKFSKIHVREGKNNYMMLFEAIDKQESYNEEAIIHKFRNEQFVKQFPVAKNYLYNLILKALDVYHSGVDLEIGYLIHCSIILYDKAMLDPALKFLKKAEALAKEHHKLSYLNKILNHELFILRREESMRKPDLLEEHYRERVENADQLRYVIEYQHLHDLVAAQYGKCYGPYREACHKEVQRLAQEPLMKKPPAALSLYAQIEYHTARLLIHFIGREFEKAYATSSMMVNELLKENEHILQGRVKATLLEHHCTACMNTGRHEEALRVMDRLKQLGAVNEPERLQLLQFISLQELIICLHKGEQDEAMKVIETVEKELLPAEEVMDGDQKGALYHMVTLTYFVNGNYKEALKWVNRILNSRLSAYRGDMVSSFRLMELLIFFETDKTDIIHYKMESFERSYKKDREHHRFELLVASQLKKIFQVAHSGGMGAAANKALTELNAWIQKDPCAVETFYRLDVRDWLESKKSGKKLSAILASKRSA
jgi:tetratricopeptide (TPR) repeat protein